MSNGLLYFHQGWTDIINCLSLINIYAEKYKTLYVLVREDARPMILFYVRGLKNVIPIFKPKHILDSGQWLKTINYNPKNKLGSGIWFKQIKNKQLDIAGFELIGYHDNYRPLTDPYMGAYKRMADLHRPVLFVQLFYEAYGIPYSDRVDKFLLHRDPVVEKYTYDRLVKEEPYICVHTNKSLGLFVTPNTDIPSIELDQTSYMFFDMLRVLFHAKEIHVIDSVWAAVCYMIDARHGLLQHVPIYVYCHRKFYDMFKNPKQLPNWTTIYNEQ